jgi:hypothetical protein
MNAPKTSQAASILLSAWFIVVLLIIPSLPLGKYGGGIAMVVGSVIGLIAFVLVHQEARRSPGFLTTVITAAVVGAVIVLALVLGRWH